MAYTTLSAHFGHSRDCPAPAGKSIRARLRRLARRLTNALDATRQRDVDREIARVLAQSGGRITDSMEREMMRKALASDWSLPQ